LKKSATLLHHQPGGLQRGADREPGQWALRPGERDEQLKNGVNAMRMPVDDLRSNWAYMVMTALAWNLKAWFGLLLPEAERGVELVRMEFRRFLHALILLPAQIVRSGRRIIYRLLAYNGWVKELFAAWEHLRVLRAT